MPFFRLHRIYSVDFWMLRLKCCSQGKIIMQWSIVYLNENKIHTRRMYSCHTRAMQWNPQWNFHIFQVCIAIISISCLLEQCIISIYYLKLFILYSTILPCKFNKIISNVVPLFIKQSNQTCIFIMILTFNIWFSTKKKFPRPVFEFAYALQAFSTLYCNIVYQLKCSIAILFVVSISWYDC